MTKQEYEAKRAELLNTAQANVKENDTKAFGETENAIKELDNDYGKSVKELNDKLENEHRMQASLDALNGKRVTPVASMRPMGNISPAEIIDNSLSGKPYRTAFMNFVMKGTPIPEQFKNVDTYTSTSDASATIPTTLLPEFIKEMKTYGELYSRVRKLNIQGGVDVPIISLKPTASWTSEGSVSDRQKITADTKVSFSYYKLQGIIAISLIANAATLDSFEREFPALMAEAMAKSIETAIVSGSGSGEPLGISNDSRIPVANALSLTATKISTWANWKKEVFSKIKKSYSTGSFIMAKGTWDTYIDGLVDSTGQPIGRVTYGIDGTNAYRFGGKEVMLVEDDILSDFDAAANEDVFALFVNLSDYAINSNMAIENKRYFDEDTDQWMYKSTLIGDGKLLDANGVLVLIASK